MKQCSRCKIEKPVEDFYKKASNADGLYYHCKSCQKTYNKAHYDSNQSYYKSKAKSWRTAHKGAKYGLSDAEFAKLFDKFSGMCWICKEKPAKVVDHDHSCCDMVGSCGTCVRGALCHGCNLGLGGFRDNPVFLKEAQEYLS